MMLLFAAVHESGSGTKLPFEDVRAMVAIEGKADIQRAAPKSRDCRVGPGNFTPSPSKNRT
jgi:hypothetical protein